ncbi:cytochrome P450 [Lentzea jiangxiensis]|uniref:Cytochrome P450 n=1 Tax=Lentzea jiangxiensis TaxID=641025 RepID=A0A1H0VFG6_9PSEU|nr:cytochrome P450 [Lentzea jiangxiensis]SDP77083.1 Cytochrome P450 [Lentzea jiangxiensis]
MEFDPRINARRVTAYADLCAVLADPVTFSSRNSAGPQLAAVAALLPPEQRRLLELMSSLNTADGARHARIRGAANHEFTQTAVRRMADPIRNRARALLDELEEEVDFVGDFAAPFALGVVADVLDVPDADFPLFREIVAPVLDLTSGEEVSARVLGPYFAAMGEFRAYFGRSNAFRGGQLSEQERLALCLAVVVAGTDSTTNMLASAVLRLDVRERRSGGVVEEVVRLDSPLTGFFRTATRPVVMGGVQVGEGEHLFLDYAAGNRDPEVFTEDFDPGRPSVPAHLGFGHGPHHCLGAQLARLQGRIVVEELLDRSCEVAEQPGDVRYRRHLISHGPAELRFRPGQRRG